MFNEALITDLDQPTQNIDENSRYINQSSKHL